ncbi:hypothetical protein PGB90_001685 [Kerria lacca]
MKSLILLTSTLIVAVVCEKLTEKSDVIEGKVEKKEIKRGLLSLGYGYGSHGYHGYHGYTGGLSNIGYGTLGGYGLGSTVSSSYPSQSFYSSAYAGLSGLHSYASYPASIHTTITKHVPVAVPHPVPIPIEKHVPYPVAAPYPVEVPRPYPVEVPKPVAVPVEKPYAVPVDRPYPVAVPQPVAVPIYKHVGIPIPQPYAVPVAKPIAVPYLNKEIYAHESW